MEITYHPMTDRPERSCSVLLASTSVALRMSCYSKKWDAFNANDHDTAEDVRLMASDEDLYFGWIYVSELLKGMVNEYEVI